MKACLGHGGFGITYAAHDKILNVRVAIKEYLPRQLATRAEGRTQVSMFTGEARQQYDYGLRKFLEEAQSVARFAHHPNVVSARDYFEANGTAYMVMEYVEGVTLKEYLAKKGGRISFEEAKGIMMPVMDALREVHQAGMLHRDISPDNIYITTTAQVKILDFGAARYFAGEQSKSLSVILKPGYAPEEQYRSNGKQGAWTDVYATAATLYRAITGQTPPEALDRMAEDTLAPPSRLGVNILPPAEQALLKALAVNAGQRFQSMGEFQQALMDGQPKTTGSQSLAVPSPTLSLASTPTPVSAQPPLQPQRPVLGRRSISPAGIAAAIGAGAIGLILVLILIMKVTLPLTPNSMALKKENHAREQKEPAQEETAEKARQDEERYREAQRQAKRESQTRAKKLFKEGDALIKQGNLKEAIAKMDEILRFDPNYVLAHFGRGFAYLKMGDYQKAVEPLRQTIKLTTKYPLAYSYLGFTYNKLNRYSEAIPIWQEVLKAQPNSPDDHYELGISYLGTGNRQKAMGQYDILQQMQISAGNPLVQKICNDKAEALLVSINRKYPPSLPSDLRQEVQQVAEKIRAAHLNKDINKWLSCYTPSYPNLRKRENEMLELWKNYDVKEVSYRISNVRRLTDHQATADTVWNIQVYDHRTHDYTLVRQGYKAILEKSSSGWRIQDSKEEGGGPG